MCPVQALIEVDLLNLSNYMDDPKFTIFLWNFSGRQWIHPLINKKVSEQRVLPRVEGLMIQLLEV
jgi:hypothetical protein